MVIERIKLQILKEEMQAIQVFFACIAKENCYHKDDISVNDILDRILIVANAEEKKGWIYS